MNGTFKRATRTLMALIGGATMLALAGSGCLVIGEEDGNVQCTVASDCVGETHPACTGSWSCGAGECSWTCTTGCSQDSDCATGEQCTAAGTCVPVVTPGCETNADCEPGQICANGECLFVQPPPCTSDSECPEGELCLDGVCVTELPPPPCSDDSACPQGEVCVDSQCVAGPSGCESAAESAALKNSTP